MTWFEESIAANSEKWKHDLAKFVYEELKRQDSDKATLQRRIFRLTPYQEKGPTTMQVSYNGFTGELVKMERKETVIRTDPLVCRGEAKVFVYDLSIYDSEKHVAHSFTGVNLEDVKFMGGEVAFK